MADQVFSGFVYDQCGVAVNGAAVALFTRNSATNTTSTCCATATTTSNSSGAWTISTSTEGRFDVRLTNGSLVLWRKYDDQVQMERAEFADVFIRNPANTFDYQLAPAAILADRVLTIPLLTGDDTFVTEAFIQTLTNKTLTSPVLTTPQINDTSADHQYVFDVSELSADRTVTLPLLTGNDEFTFNGMIQTLTNKTLTSPVLTTPQINDTSSDHQYIFGVSEL